MAWLESNFAGQPPINVNKELLQTVGELSEDEARLWLGKFLMYNTQFLVELLFGVKLHPRQAVLMRTWAQHNYNLAVWARGAAKTLAYSPESMLLVKNKGFVSLVELLPNLSFEQEGWKDIEKIELWNGHSWQSTDKIYVQPQKDCLKIETSDGYSLMGSTNHIIKIYNELTNKIEWKRYGDLKIGDYACISRNPVNFEFGDKEDNYEREAYLLGLLVGDGCYTEKWGGASLTCGDQETIDWVYQNWEIMSYTPHPGIAIDVNFSTKVIEPLFEYYGVKRGKSYTKEIPPRIKQSKNALKFFLSGLFDTDGCVEKNGKTVSFSSTSKLLAEQVHNSLLLFGIISRIVEKKTSSPFGKSWNVSIGTHNIDIFAKEIGFKLTRKQNRLTANKIRNPNKDTIPNLKRLVKSIKSNTKVKKGQSLYKGSLKKFHNFKEVSYQKLGRLIDCFTGMNSQDPDLQKLQILQGENFYINRIDKIEALKHDCLDFNVPNGEMYWSNGFISHNSTLVGLYSVIYCLSEPNMHALIISQNFRSSRRILENLERLAASKGGALFRQTIKGDLSRRNDIFQYKFLNGSTITAVPLANGEGLRGLRCGLLIIDEGSLLSISIIETILKPFLIASGDIKQKLKLRELEDKMIRKGLMKEEERQIFESNSKMIIVGSASYQWEDFYKIYQQHLKHIEKDNEAEIKLASYCVTQIGYKAVPPDLLDKAVLQDIESGETSKSIIDKEYNAIFVSDSAGYFRASKMANCTFKDGSYPITEIYGERGAEYILSIDPSFSDAENSDHFAMNIIKIITVKDKKVGLLVHNYAVAGADFKDHVLYFYYLIKSFNVVFIAIDASQGANEFTVTANESKLFKDANIEFHAIEADFKKEDQNDLVREIRNSYNLPIRRIVMKQPFLSHFQRVANEYLQGCFDYQKIMFAAKAAAIDGATEGLKMPEILKEHSIFKEWSVFEFIEEQDSLIDLTKKECALIEVSTTAQGSQSFDLPQALKRSKSKSRSRKDSYSTLLLGAWATKLYLESQALPVDDTETTFTPFQA